ncbi:la ribonucleoprotein translational regulator Achilles [Haematobia irritans]|uniref:la ribonucleoprotein translational regulator Achilles n=1 Tax=Haematobia irritans TaxID=7368 RepID=UPI003F4FB397
MSDQENSTSNPSQPPPSMPKAEEIIDLTSSTENVPNKQESDDQGPVGLDGEVCEVRSQHIKNGHTFVVTTVRTETTTMTKSTESCVETNNQHPVEDILKAVPITMKEKPNMQEEMERPCSSSSCSSPEHSTKAVVPLSSSLPSKLLRLHAKRSAQALLQQLDSQNHSLDSQFGSDEGMPGGCSEDDSSIEASAPPMSPPPPRNSPSENGDERIDVGMGSSIEGSEESEEDDELKPLAVDNHVLHDIDLGSPSTFTSNAGDCSTVSSSSTTTTAVLSEANLEKFRKNHQPGSQHHPHMDNIYLHPNFKYEHPLRGEASSSVAPSSEQKRVHRSFLTMKKSTSQEAPPEVANSVISQATTASADNKTLVNEIDTLDPSLIPSDELAAEIAEAVEFYFSNESILKDAFLLKHVKRNKEGFVSLKLVSSFKRVRQLTKEWKVVGNAVRRKSQKIELNDIGTKVRRKEPLPNFDETMPSRTIVVCDLPLDKLTIEKVSDLFSKCGEIALIRILKPGMAIPVDVRQFMNKYPEMQQKECALVEYLESASAREARNLQGPFKVYEMVAPKKKTGKKAVIQVTAPVVRMVENYRYFGDHNYERTRGGSFSGTAMPHEFDLRYRLKRNNSDFTPKTYATDVQNAYASVSTAGSGTPTGPYQHSPTHYSGSHRASFQSEQQHQPTAPPYHHHYQPRGSINQDVGPQSPMSPGANQNYFAYNPRRYSNTSTISASTANMESPKPMHQHAPNAPINTGSGHNLQRRLSNCSQEGGYADVVRRTSNCSDNVPQRRDSNCSDNCPCSRRISDYGQNNETYRKSSLGSMGSNNERRFSNGSMQFERTFSNASDLNNSNSNNGSNVNTYHRRMSNDFNLDRKQSLDTQPGTPYEDPNVGGGGGGYNVFPRRYSNNFNNISSKLAAYDNAQYINGRRISTDSGYDRRCSFGSEYEGSPRSRTNSFLNNYKHSGASDSFDGQPRSRTGSFIDGSPRSRSGSFATRAAEHLVRTPIGPDGSKGFGFRARKIDHTVGPV